MLPASERLEPTKISSRCRHSHPYRRQVRIRKAVIVGFLGVNKFYKDLKRRRRITKHENRPYGRSVVMKTKNLSPFSERESGQASRSAVRQSNREHFFLSSVVYIPVPI